jgi:hypothetical protein
MTSPATAPATRTPVPATLTAPRIRPPTGSGWPPGDASGTGSAGWRRPEGADGSARARWPALARALSPALARAFGVARVRPAAGAPETRRFARARSLGFGPEARSACARSLGLGGAVSLGASAVARARSLGLGAGASLGASAVARARSLGLAAAASAAAVAGSACPAASALALSARSAASAAAAPGRSVAALGASWPGSASAPARFSLRFPGRERGRFSITPPSSAIAGSLELIAVGYSDYSRGMERRKSRSGAPAGGGQASSRAARVRAGWLTG